MGAQDESLQEAQRLVARYVRPGHSLVDELLEERRREAELEEQEATSAGEARGPRGGSSD
jgi:vacuolar-type H+-ATPase subunit H